MYSAVLSMENKYNLMTSDILLEIGRNYSNLTCELMGILMSGRLIRGFQWENDTFRKLYFAFILVFDPFSPIYH